jgi:hypothetical protein
MKYLKIAIGNNLEEEEVKMDFIKRIILWFVNFILPKANPEFDDIIKNVKYWFLEFENENEFPTREIGLDCDGRIIMKMPYKNNYGYWTDNNLRIKDFDRLFKVQYIDKKEFEDKWVKFKI